MICVDRKMSKWIYCRKIQAHSTSDPKNPVFFPLAGFSALSYKISALCRFWEQKKQQNQQRAANTRKFILKRESCRALEKTMQGFILCVCVCGFNFEV